MLDALFASLSLLNVSGFIILLCILALLVGGVVATFVVRARYGRIAEDLRQNGDVGGRFESPVLNEIARASLAALRLASDASGVNTQAIVEQHVQSSLRGLLVAERFVKATTGLTIIFGLVGTFYGLSMSIGKLVTLVAGNVTDSTEIAQSLTRGLVDALAGMSVAFSSSLFGILAAIILTLVGVFFGVGDRRTAVMVEIESYLDNVLLSQVRERGAALSPPGQRPGADPRLDQALATFGQSVDRLDGVVVQFESALSTFASSTRDFKEFNHHLKDNIQRMSLSFADLSETLKQTGARSRDGR